MKTIYGLILFFSILLAGPGIIDVVNNHPDTTKAENGCNKGISLEKRILPTKRRIEFITEIYPKLAEPSIIYFHSSFLPKQNNIVTLPLGRKITDAESKIMPGPKVADTLYTVLIQEIVLNKKIYKQGEIATLLVSSTRPISKPQIKFLKRNYELYLAGKNLYKTILAVPMDADTGQHYLIFRYSEDDQNKILKLPFRIIPGDFAYEDTIELDISILTEEILEMLRYENARYFYKAYTTDFPTLLINGDFIWPCDGIITSLYGRPRRYNKDLDKWSHKAIDIANNPGVKVVAANTGIVVMAEELQAHGKSVVLAHGQGIHTVYLHLDKIYVKKGDTVAIGTEIGELGKTGICTGPNLHFQVMVNRIPTDPRYWIPGGVNLKKGDLVKSSSNR